MAFVYLAITVALLWGVGWLMDKMGAAALIGLNRGVLYRGAYKEGKHLREGFTIVTTASIPALMDELETYVCDVDAPLGGNVVLYESARAKTAIAWTYGSASEVKLEAVLAFTRRGDATEGMFSITRWLEEDGLFAAQDELKKLRLQIQAAIRAADPEARMTDGDLEPDEVTARYGNAFAEAD